MSAFGTGESRDDVEVDHETDGATGDETVGTLPSVASDDLPGGTSDGPTGVTRADRVLRSRDGALLLDGPFQELLGLLGRTRSNGLIAFQLDDEGGANVAMLDDFQVRIRATQLEGMQLRASIGSEEGLLANVSFGRRSHTFALAAGEVMIVPLDLSLLNRAPLAIESVNVQGEVTRLTLRRNGEFVVMTQTRH